MPTWVSPFFRVLARLKFLRGTRLDPFGFAEVRVLERALVPEYRDALVRLTSGLRAENLEEAVRIAALPDEVRGYEDLKLERAAKYREELAAALAGHAGESHELG